jgi:hypothetical protein
MPTDENEIPQVPSPAPTAEPASPPVETPDAAADAAREAALTKVQEDLKAGTLGDEPPAPPAQDKAPEKPAPAADASKTEVDPDAAYDDPDDVREDEVDPKFTKIRERIQKTRGALRETRKQLAQHEARRSITKQAGFDDAAHEEWIMLGARANMGDPEAIAELGQRLLRAGFQPPAQTPAVSDDEAIEAEAEAIYEAKFAAKVKAYKMDEDAARELALEMAEAKAPIRQAAPQPPAPSQPQSQIPPQPAPAGPDPITRAALGTIQQTNATYAKNLPNWKDVEALATEMVHRDRAQGVRLHPLQWLADWQTKVRAAQVHLARSAIPAPAVQVRDTGMRPGRGAGAAPSGADPRSARMADIQAALASGNLDALP